MSEHPHPTPGGFTGHGNPWAYHQNHSHWRHRGPRFGGKVIWFGLGVGAATFYFRGHQDNSTHRCHREAVGYGVSSRDTPVNAEGSSLAQVDSRWGSQAHYHDQPASRWNEGRARRLHGSAAPPHSSTPLPVPEPESRLGTSLQDGNQQTSTFDEEKIKEYRRLASVAFSDLTDSGIDNMIALLDGLKNKLKLVELDRVNSSPSKVESEPSSNNKLV